MGRPYLDGKRKYKTAIIQDDHSSSSGVIRAGMTEIYGPHGSRTGARNYELRGRITDNHSVILTGLPMSTDSGGGDHYVLVVAARSAPQLNLIVVAHTDGATNSSQPGSE